MKQYRMLPMNNELVNQKEKKTFQAGTANSDGSSYLNNK